MTPEIQAAIDAATAPLRTEIQTLQGGNASLCRRIEALEDRIATLERKPQVTGSDYGDWRQ